MIIFTSICANYVHKARTLAQSVKQHIPDARFVVCLVEREIDSRIPADYFDDIILAKDAWEGNFDRFIFKHAIVEASTAVKGQFFRYLLRKHKDENQFVYLDPDCYVYDDFVELRELLGQYPIVLCPHLLHPGNIDMELSSTAHGVYNLGFLAINHSNEAEEFINWWADRLYLFCYDDIQRGIFTDQKWIDLAPCFFHTYIFKHNGYDFAPWSLKGSRITRENEKYAIQGDPLRFIHFSGFGSVAEKCMTDWIDNDGVLFHELYDYYAQKHNANNNDNVSSAEWTYANYKDGSKISDTIRKLYRSNYDVMFTQDDPFAGSNKYFSSVLKNKCNGEKQGWLAKAKHIVSHSFESARKDGIIILFRKALRKLLRIIFPPKAIHK